MLGREDIENADDGDLIFLVADELIARVDDLSPEDQPGFVRESLSPGQRMVWGVFLLDGEVNNGGFNQYFWNDSHQYVQEAAEGLRLIGAGDHARLLDEAMARFEARKATLAPYHAEGTIEAFSESYEDPIFSDLDDRYFELDVIPLQESYIRSHPEQFA